MKNRSRSTRQFASFEEAVNHSVSHPWFPKTRETARNIVERHVKKLANGRWAFTHDARTYGQRQLLYVSEEQRIDLCRRVACPVLLIEASRPRSESSQAYFDQYVHLRLKAIRDFSATKVDGNHHVHSDSPQQVATAIMQWWNRRFRHQAKL